MTESPIGIVGAGPAGMAAAYTLARAGRRVEVFEAGPAVGGMAKTIALWDQRVDLGPHRFFSADARVNRLWLEAVGDRYRMVNRLTRIYYKNTFFNYPLKAGNALRNLGLFEAARCVASFAKERVCPTQEAPGSFQNWVINRFGKRLFEIFFKTYSEKLWGISCTELDADFAAQRIKKLSLLEAVKNALVGHNQHKHRTLVDRFAYPLGGTGAAYESMAEYVQEHGGNVHLQTPVRRILTGADKRRGSELELMDGTTRKFSHVISSMPLTTMVRQLPDVPQEVVAACSNLRFRNTILVYLLVDGKDLFPDNWLYIHADNLATGRITNFRNWVPELYGKSDKTILALEYWCYDQDAVWQAPDAELIAKADREVRSTGLVGNCAISDGAVYRIPKCYPVYERGYKEHLAIVQDYLKSLGAVTAIGRYGAFKYNNQDHSILMGMMAADNIIANCEYDLWAVNTDYDDYQEEAFISETGLVRSSKRAAS